MNLTALHVPGCPKVEADMLCITSRAIGKQLEHQDLCGNVGPRRAGSTAEQETAEMEWQRLLSEISV